VSAIDGETEFDVGEGTLLLGEPTVKSIDWGNIPTPAWAIDAKIEQIKLQRIELKK